MNFFKVLYKESCVAFDKFLNKYEDYLILIPLVYNNIYLNNNIINLCYFIYFYKNRNYYLSNIIDFILNIKLEINKIFKTNLNFTLKKVLLYTNLRDNIDVTKYFISKMDIINKNTIDNILPNNDNNDDIRLKLYFKYNNIDYIIYIPYNTLTYSYIPYPLYNESILNNYRNNIVVPRYVEQSNKKKIYSLFNLESKDILYVKINNIEYDKKYFEMIQSPFSDFGLLYGIRIKLLWILSENNINIDTFEKFELKFLNLYFDEDAMDLKEHLITLTKDDINKYLISERMKGIISK
jgi:hypothetical protein